MFKKIKQQIADIRDYGDGLDSWIYQKVDYSYYQLECLYQYLKAFFNYSCEDLDKCCRR